MMLRGLAFDNPQTSQSAMPWLGRHGAHPALASAMLALHEGGRVFFVVSTGRSGSQTLSRVLSQAPDVLCVHEPHPQLVRESACYRYGRLSEAELVALLRRTRPAEVNGRRYGETNNRLGLVVPALRRAFPEAQLLWLLRDGRAYVASEVQRGAFRSNQPRLPWRRSKWDRWRFSGDAAGAVPPATWNSWSPFEKTCWQWGYVNRLIRDDLADLPRSARRVLRIEDLAASLVEICGWLAITPVPFSIPRSNARRAVGPEEAVTVRHPNAVDEVKGWTGWSSEQRATFERHGADLMDEHYPGWRTADGTWHPLPAQPPLATSAEDDIAELCATAAALRIDLYERDSELADLRRSPRQLLLHLAVALRKR
jgi:hypothetical protein